MFQTHRFSTFFILLSFFFTNVAFISPDKNTVTVLTIYPPDGNIECSACHAAWTNYTGGKEEFENVNHPTSVVFYQEYVNAHTIESANTNGIDLIKLAGFIEEL